jgi:hypothetical protein
MARRRALEPSPLGLIGGGLAIISSFLAWDDMARVAYEDSFQVPLQFLWDEDASGGFKLGIPLVTVAAAVALFSLSPIAPIVFLRRLGVSCCSRPSRWSSSNSGDGSAGTS